MTTGTSPTDRRESLENFAHVRYQVADVERAIAFYTEQLGFAVELQAGKAFGSVLLGKLRLLLGGRASSGARPLPDGRQQESGGWNRIVLYVDDLDARIEELKQKGIRPINEIESGPGGRQVLILDPDQNPIELHEAPKRAI
jgi:catechol 2,3-dioxygenase-like lactoylglutathione lyase family enzyme